MEDQGTSYFRFVAETLALKEDMIQQIRRTPLLPEPAREKALALAMNYLEVPARLNDASWSVSGEHGRLRAPTRSHFARRKLLVVKNLATVTF